MQTESMGGVLSFMFGAWANDAMVRAFEFHAGRLKTNLRETIDVQNLRT